MNMRSLVMAALAMTTLALSACVVSTTGTSGSGGASSTSGSGAGGGGVGGGTGSGGENTGGGGVGGGGVGGGGTCVSCADAITNGTVDQLCDGTDAAKAYDALSACTCMGGCAVECGDNVCMSLDITMECQMCIQSGACSAEFTDCANN